MPRTKISEFSANPNLNTDIDGINIAEGCAPSGINDAIRELMAQLKDQQTGASGDPFTVGGSLTVTGPTTLTGLATFAAGQTFPGTGDVTTSGTQTLTNKTIAYSSNTLTGVQPTLVSGTSIKTVNGTSLLGSGDVTTGDVTTTGTQTLTNKTLTAPTLSGAVLNDGYTEEVHTLTGTALNPANGSIQIITLSGNTTFTDSLSAGQSIILGIDDGSAATVTWPTITWTTTPASAPTLATSGYTWVTLWKVGTTLYGKY